MAEEVVLMKGNEAIAHAAIRWSASSRKEFHTLREPNYHASL